MLTTPTFKSYQHALRYILESGSVADSRVGPMDEEQTGLTKEVLGLVYEFSPGDEVYRLGYSRKLAWTEALHLLTGSFDKAHFEAISPKSAAMFTEAMAYGPRVQPQLEKAVLELHRNPHSRRSVVYISDQESWPPPCTLSIQFLLRPDKHGQGIPRLHTFVTMRAWDLVLGLPYDTFMFGALALQVAFALNMPVGPVRVTAASAHIYQKHWTVDTEQAGNIMKSFDIYCREWSTDGSELQVVSRIQYVRQSAKLSLISLPWAEGEIPTLFRHRAPL